MHMTLTKRQDLRRHIKELSRTQIAHCFEWFFEELIRGFRGLKAVSQLQSMLSACQCARSYRIGADGRCEDSCQAYKKSWPITANFEIRNHLLSSSIECFKLADIVEDSLIFSFGANRLRIAHPASVRLSNISTGWSDFLDGWVILFTERQMSP